MDFELPEDNVCEISLIGTGGGYGESVVVHLGHKNWIVVDSCIDPKSKKSLPLTYLETLGVDITNDVKMVICTHWHDDHILGISQIVEKCNNSVFCMAKPNDLKKFLQLVGLDHRKIDIEISNSSTVEFSKCLNIIQNRDQNKRKNALADKTLISLSFPNNIRSEVISLSPSDYTMNLFDQEISSLITEYGPSSKKIITQTPNAKSVVLFLKMGPHRAILGADLEVNNNNNAGWLHILDHSQAIDDKSTVFKIPHHGSINGYHERIWTELLYPNPISKLTPWNKNQKLPEAEMLKRYIEHTDKLYMTTASRSDKSKKRNKSIEKTIKKMNLRIREVKFSMGIIQSRINIEEKESNWEVRLYENAFHVNSQVA